MRLTYGAPHLQPRPQARQQMHRTLSQVVRDRTGVPGLALLQALLAGERDPLTLAQLRHPPGQHRADEMAKALQGPWRAAPRLAFRHAVDLSPCSHQPLTRCAQHLQTPLGPCADKSHGPPLPPQARRHKQAHAPRFEARPPSLAGRVSI